MDELAQKQLEEERLSRIFEMLDSLSDLGLLEYAEFFRDELGVDWKQRVINYDN